MYRKRRKCARVTDRMQGLVKRVCELEGSVADGRQSVGVGGGGGKEEGGMGEEEEGGGRRRTGGGLQSLTSE